MNKGDIITIELTFVNAFLVRVKEGYVLIDSGLGMHWTKLENELISYGCLPDKLKLVIITHGDFDHAGTCAKLQEKYKIKVAIHKDDSLMVENGLSLKLHTILFPVEKVVSSTSKSAVRNLWFVISAVPIRSCHSST